MKTSCGIIILNSDNEILLCHVTGQTQYDIPKGLMDEGETYIDCAIRECQEETSLIFTEDDLTEIGLVPYNKKKQLYLFMTVKDDINLENLTCVSLFEHFHTKEMLPEVDEFIWVAFSDIKDYCTPAMMLSIYSCVTIIT